MKLEFSEHIFEKYSHSKCIELPSSGSRVVPYGRTDGRTDVTKLIVAFHRSGMAPKSRRGSTYVSRFRFYVLKIL